jgi:hypothetical protein
MPLQWHCSRKIVCGFPFYSGQFFKKYRRDSQHIGKIEEISAEGLWFKLSELIPRYWSGPTIWAESAPALGKSEEKHFCQDSITSGYMLIVWFLIHPRKKLRWLP